MFTENKLYRADKKSRIYPFYIDIYDLFDSEFLIHINNNKNLGYKFFYLNFKSKHNFYLNKNDLDYLYFNSTSVYEPLNYFFSENVKKIKYLQKIDLFFLSNLKNLIMLILIPKLDQNNKYYFNLVLGVKSEFDINQFILWNLNSVILHSVVELNDFNLSQNYIKKIFDFKNNKFKNTNRINDQSINCQISSLWYNQFNDKKIINLTLSKRCIYFYKNVIFKDICFHIYWFDGKNQFNDSLFQIDFVFNEKITIINSNSKLKMDTSYNFYSFLDLLSYDLKYLCFSWWELYRYL